MKKRTLYLFLISLLVLLSGCGRKEQESKPEAAQNTNQDADQETAQNTDRNASQDSAQDVDENIGQDDDQDAAQNEKEGNERTVVTMMFTAMLPEFEALVEEKYPDIDLQVERNTEITMDGESERRLHNGHGTDIVTTTIPMGDVRNYVMDLSAEPYIDRYQTAILQNISNEGKTLFVPLPGQFYGYIYNAALAEEGKLLIPTKQMEIVDMLDEAYAQKLGVGEDGTVFTVMPSVAQISAWLIATQVPDFLGQAEGITWNEKMLGGEAGFADGMTHCLDLASLLAERGYFNVASLYLSSHIAGNYNRNAVPFEERMLNGEMMMVYGSTRLLTYLNENSDAYEYSILPVMGNEESQPWTITIPDAYLSINAELSKPGHEAVLDACSRVLDLLSTPEGQSAYIDDCGIAYSFLSSYDLDTEDVPEGLRECVEDGYVYNILLPGQLLNYFGNRMIAVLNGDAQMEEALAAVDHYYRYGDEEVDYDQSLVGLIDEDMIYENYNVRREETSLGNFVADAIRERTGTQIAFANGGSIRGSLYAGNVFGEDLDTVCPYANHLVTLEVSGSVIRAMLANGISAMVQENGIPGGRFLNVSGLCYSFSPPDGDKPAKLLEVTLPDGTPIQDEEKYTITATDYMAGISGYADNNGDGFEMINVYSDEVPKAEDVRLIEETPDTFVDALENYFAIHKGEAVSAKCDGRIKAVEGND